jgi:hypothetical protein
MLDIDRINDRAGYVMSHHFVKGLVRVQSGNHMER